MNSIYPWFWTALIFGSIAWYAFLLIFVGIKGGADIVRMIDLLVTKQRGNH
ncbi:MAG: hypothetical protein IT427_14355 [Pirellulales bacterium]|nr:hypothetical protein [Pirellulales bacterium]